MNDWKNYKWLVILLYVFLSFTTLLWLIIMDTFTTILLILVAILTITARKQYNCAVQLNEHSSNPAHSNTLILNNEFESDITEINPFNKTTQIEQRINELVNENLDLTEDEIKEIILKEEKEKLLNEAIGNIKININSGSTQKTIHKKAPAQSEETFLSYSNIRKLTPNFIVLDFETTGLSHFNDEIIQIAAVRYINFNEVEKYVTFVKPLIPIPPRITKINGISDNDVKNSPTISTVLTTLVDFIKDDVIVAHNAPFDMKFLLTNMYKAGFEYKRFKVIDTLSLARKHIHSTENHKLVTLKEFLKLDRYISHEALHDCYVTAELYKYCFEESLIK